MINPDGQIILSAEGYDNIADSNFQDLLAENSYKPVICISLKKYLLQVVTDVKIQPKVKDLHLLEPIEMDVLKAMREGRVKELKIIMGNNTKTKDLIKTYSGEVPMDEAMQIAERFLGKKHVGLEMKSSDGRVVTYSYNSRNIYKN